MLIKKEYCFFLVGNLLGVLLLMYVFIPNQILIGTVNLTGMIDQFIQQESQKNLSPEVLKKEVNTFGKTLDKELKMLSKDKHVVLFPREAIIAGGHDYTTVIQQRMKNSHDR